VTPLTRRAAQWRFLVLTALRWGPVGLFIPVFVLLPLDRGLTLSEVGLTVAVQGLVVLLLELPTGGLADAWGRRPVLVLAGIVAVASTALFLSASSVAGFALAYLLQGVYRALDSGPLEAWYVDAVHVANDGDRDRHGTEREIERGLSRAGAVLGVAIAAGALAGGGLVALGGVGPFEALALPVALALALQVLGLVAVVALMPEMRRAAGARAAVGALREAPRTVVGGLRLLRTSPVLLAIVAVELFWGFGAATYEALLPVRLTELLDDPEQAAVLVGPAGSAAWLASALGAAMAPGLIRGVGTAAAAALLRVLHGGFRRPHGAARGRRGRHRGLPRRLRRARRREPSAHEPAAPAGRRRSPRDGDLRQLDDGSRRRRPRRARAHRRGRPGVGPGRDVPGRCRARGGRAVVPPGLAAGARASYRCGA
jgi:MFS transporter, DHA1 family, tetracycline resistance protein